MASLYILFSPSLNKYYTGITNDIVQTRLLKHNASYYGKHFTSGADDWDLKLELECESYSEARKLELFIKRMKSRKFIDKIISNDGEREKLLQRIKSN